MAIGSNVLSSLTSWMLVGIFGGLIIGITLEKTTKLSKRQIMYIEFCGSIYVRMLKGIALPLMASSLACSFGSLKRILSLRIFIQFLVWMIIFKLEAALLGLAVCATIQPGSMAKHKERFERSRNITWIDVYLDTLRNCFPPNVMEMFLSTYQTKLIRNDSRKIQEWEPSHVWVESVNMMGIAAWALVAGISIKTMGSAGKSVLEVITCFCNATFILVDWILMTSPVCLASLIAGHLLKNSIGSLVAHAGEYVATYCCSHLLQVFVVYPLIYVILVRKSPLCLFCPKALMTAAATGSSLAALPFAISFYEDEWKFDTRLVRSILTVGIHISKDGAAMLMTIAGMFMIQSRNEPYMFGEYVGLVLMSIAGSVAAPGIPFGAFVVCLIILQGAGLSLGEKDYGLFMSVEWFRDRLDAITNVSGNCFLLVILTHYNSNQLEPEEEQDIDGNEQTEFGGELPDKHVSIDTGSLTL